MYQLNDPELRRISTFATAPFFNSTVASQPEPLITRPRNSCRFGLWPTTITESWREYFSSIFWKSENVASGRRAVSSTSFPSCPISFPTSAAVCVERFSGLDRITSTCAPKAARARPTYPHCSMPSLSRPRFSSFLALLIRSPALACRKKYRNISRLCFLYGWNSQRPSWGDCRNRLGRLFPFGHGHQELLCAECRSSMWRFAAPSTHRLP